MITKILISFVVFLFSFVAFGQPCTSPSTINFSYNSIHLCTGGSGTNTATVVGAVGPITYNWLNESSTTNTLTFSPTDTTWYYLEITDDCFTVLDSFKVYVDTVFVSSLMITNATNCPGQPGTLGSIEVFPDNPTYTFTLFGGGNVYGPQFNNQFINLPGGVSYFVHVENPYGCFIDTAISVGLGANAVVATWDAGALTEASCFGSADGAASVLNISGGITAPYNVIWTNSSGVFDQTTVGVGGGDNVTNLTSGDWVVTVTDQEGCAWSNIFEIGEPTEIILNLSITNPTCYLFNDGSVVANFSGGSGGYTVVMTNAAGTQMNFANGIEINSLGTGWYYVNITDNTGCFTEDSAYVDDPGELNIDLILTESLCYNGGNGSAIVDTIYNYNGNYNAIAYFWNPNPSGLNGIGQDTCAQLGGGNHTLIINDQSGCSQSIDFTIISPPELYFDIIGSSPSTGGTDGVVYASAAGGVGPYTYTWTNLTTLATSNNTTWGGLLGADYEIVVVDANGCSLTDIVTIGYLGAEENATSEAFQIYPSVINDGVIYFNNQFESNVLLVIYNLQGEIVLQIVLEQNDKQHSLHLGSGTYFYQVIENQSKTEKIAQGKIVIVN